MAKKIIFCTIALTTLLFSGCGQQRAQGPGNSSTPDTTAPSNTISETQAKEIALSRVPGATTQDIRRFEPDYDDGRLRYEGQIYYGQKEYEFEINGYNGAIIEWDVDPIYEGIF